ncbi:MAG: 50S ribosomal protein L23 [Candidatus Omnitrophica bacterium]|nr:50S ribosomal protein L23 [Candidatus Omnitrophota bacterium]
MSTSTNPHDIIVSIIRTEKGASMMPQRKYLFWVRKNANKIDIKQAVQFIYKVKVHDVNTVTMRGKNKRVRFEAGKTPDWKKAIVTLKENEKIEIT